MKRPEVIVVGAGPVGLSVALGLAQARCRALVLEKDPTTAEHSRAPAIWPRTQEILSGFGVLDAFLSRGTILRHIRLWDADRGGELFSIPLEELEDETDCPQLLILPQLRTERLLCEALRRQETARVLFSAEVTAIRQRASGVRVSYRREGELQSLDAPFAVGCDGAHSVVRDALDVSFEGVTYRTRAALADLRMRVARDLPFPRLSTRDGVAVAIRMDEQLWRVILPFRAGDDRPLDRRVAAAASRLFPHVHSIEAYDLVWQSEFRLHRRIASRFVKGRIVLAGDAAHLNSPVGGQGMNAGIQDAAVLAKVLLRALERGDDACLEDYERERRPAVEQGVNLFTDRMTRLLLSGGGITIRPVLAMASLVLRIPRLRRRFLSRLAMLPVP